MGLLPHLGLFILALSCSSCIHASDDSATLASGGRKVLTDHTYPGRMLNVIQAQSTARVTTELELKSALTDQSIETITISGYITISYETFPQAVYVNRPLVIQGETTNGDVIDVNWVRFVRLNCTFPKDDSDPDHQREPPCVTVRSLRLYRALDVVPNHVLFDALGPGNFLFDGCSVQCACYDWNSDEVLHQFKFWSMLLGSEIVGEPLDEQRLKIENTPFIDFLFLNTSSLELIYRTRVSVRQTTLVCVAGMPEQRPPVVAQPILPHQYVCYNKSDGGGSYRGRAGKPGNKDRQYDCQPWSSQVPQTHIRTPYNFPLSGLEGAYCRNPEAVGVKSMNRPWCYTTDVTERWAFCVDIPVCEEMTDEEIMRIFATLELDDGPGDGSGGEATPNRVPEIVGLSVGLGATVIIVAVLITVGIAQGWIRRGSSKDDGRRMTGPKGAFSSTTTSAALAVKPDSSTDHRDILEDLTVAQVFRFCTVPTLMNRVGHQMTGFSRRDPSALALGQLHSSVWIANLDGNAVAVKRLRGWDDPNLTQEDRARALMGVLINHPSSFVNYFGYCIVEVEEDDPLAPPVVRLVQDEDVDALPAARTEARAGPRSDELSKQHGSSYAPSTSSSNTGERGEKSGRSSPRRFRDTFGKIIGKASKHSLGWATTLSQGGKGVSVVSKPMSAVIKRKDEKKVASGGEEAAGDDPAYFDVKVVSGAHDNGRPSRATSQRSGSPVPRPQPNASEADHKSRAPSQAPPAAKSVVECWIVMEFADIGSLEDELTTLSALWEDEVANWSVILQIAVALAKGLRFIHGRKIFHGNLKPSNVVFAERGGELQVKMVDIAFSEKPKPHTPDRYIPPEGKMSMSADVFAFGVVLWEMLHAPWLKKRDELLFAETAPGSLGEHHGERVQLAGHAGIGVHAHTSIASLSSVDLSVVSSNLNFPDVSPQVTLCRREFASLIQRCCALDPLQRPSILDVLKELMLIQRKISPRG